MTNDPRELGGAKPTMGAVPLLERALGIFEKTFGPEPPHVSDPLLELAEVALARGRAGEAVPLARRALAVLDEEGTAAAGAEARFLLARAQWDAPADQGGDRSAAVGSAEQAQDELRKAGETKPLAKVEAWLREHRLEGAGAGDR